MSVKIDQLSIGYRHSGKVSTVADSINLNLNDGELVCLMGPNGIGKSTLLRTLTGLQPPLGGQIFINGIDIQTSSAQERARQVAIVLTERPSVGFMTVRELVSLGRYPYTNWRSYQSPDDEGVITTALEQVGLMDRQHQPVAELSDGYVQKALIARALTQDTSLVVLDEPTVHLDIKNKTEVIRLLEELVKVANKTILLSTHDLDLALKHANKLWLFDENEIKIGLPEDLVLNGSVATTFGDYNDERRIITKELSKNISLIGSGLAFELTAQALHKNGIFITQQSNEVFEINNINGTFTWIRKSDQHSFDSIESLISDINQS